MKVLRLNARGRPAVPQQAPAPRENSSR